MGLDSKMRLEIGMNKNKKNKKDSNARGISLNIVNKTDVEVEYVNAIAIHHNPFEFELEFVFVDLNDAAIAQKSEAKSIPAELKAKLVVSAGHFSGILSALNREYAKFRENQKLFIENSSPVEEKD